MEEKWTMPGWMEPYRDLLTDGGRAEELMSGKRATIQINAPLALIQMGMEAEIALLQRMHARGIEQLIESARLIDLLCHASGEPCDGFRFREGISGIREGLRKLGRAPYDNTSGLEPFDQDWLAACLHIILCEKQDCSRCKLIQKHIEITKAEREHGNSKQ